MSGCRVGWVTLKDGGTKVRVIESSNHGIMTIKYSWGEVSFRIYDDQKIERRDALYLLRCAEENILRGEL